ncbi:MAG: retention module-containing protein, partial [Burkholderiales bacterium]
MATTSTANASVGTIKVVIGDVKIIGVDGVARQAQVGDKVFAKEVIQTNANAIVQVQLENGRMLDLGRDSKIALDDDVLGAGQAAATAPQAPTQDIAALQAQIAAGADPSKVAEATAAGGAPGAGGGADGGGGTAVYIEQANSTGLVTSGFNTGPASIAFPDIEGELFINLPPRVISITGGVSVSEEGLEGGLPDSDGNNDTTNSTVYTGQMDISDPEGQPLNVDFGIPPITLFSHGEQIIWELQDDNNTLIGKIIHTSEGQEGSVVTEEIILIATIDNDGNFTVEVLGPIDHPGAGEEDDIDLNIPVIATDPFGLSGSGVLTVNLEDDSPTIATGGEGEIIVPAGTVNESGIGGLGENNTLADAQNIPRASFGVQSNADLGNDALPSVSITGNISPVHDQDIYKVELQAGETITLDIDYGMFDIDTVLTLYSADGTVIAQNDDNSTGLGGGGSAHSFDAYISFTVPAGGIYYVGVTTFPDFPGNGATQDFNSSYSGDYVLNLSITPTGSSTGLGGSGNGYFADNDSGGSGGGNAIVTGNLQVAYGADGPKEDDSAGFNDPKPNFSLLGMTTKDGESLVSEALTSNGDPVTLAQTWAGTQVTITGQAMADGGEGGTTDVFTLVVDTLSGNYTFTLLGPIDHPDAGAFNTQVGSSDPLLLTFNFQFTDFDNDTVVQQLNITVNDDGPTLAEGGEGSMRGFVEEDGMSVVGTGDLSTGNKQSGDTNADDETTGGTSGSLAQLYDFGADGPGNFVMLTDTSGLPELYSQGEPVEYDVEGNVLTATADGRDV